MSADALYAQLSERPGVLPSVCGRVREEGEEVWSCRDLGRSSPAPSLPSDDEGGEEPPVVILTAETHAEGAWVTDLQASAREGWRKPAE